MQRDSCFRGSSIMLKEKITFWAPFSCNWHRRLRVPAVDKLQERVDKRKTGKHARSPAVKKHPVATKGLKSYSRASERLGVGEGSSGVLLTTCSVWKLWGLRASMCKPLSSLPFFSPSLSLSLPFSLTHRQGRSFSVCAHILLGQHHLESTDTALIELSEGSSFSERMIALEGLHRLSSARSKEGETVKAFQPRLSE